ncbi:hypothetical protein TcCL_ESM03242 [Trypanosoma cruzi]|nr:hypothetical protein TcCL_ESM03242 [Trypanosoma cruzi]
MAGSLRCARGTWERWMTRHWDSLPATTRTFVCAGGVTATSGNLHIPSRRGLWFTWQTPFHRQGILSRIGHAGTGMPTRGIFLFPNFPPAVRNSCTTADTEGCGVSVEGTIFTEAFSTAACVYAPSR